MNASPDPSSCSVTSGPARGAAPTPPPCGRFTEHSAAYARSGSTPDRSCWRRCCRRSRHWATPGPRTWSSIGDAWRVAAQLSLRRSEQRQLGPARQRSLFGVRGRRPVPGAWARSARSDPALRACDARGIGFDWPRVVAVRILVRPSRRLPLLGLAIGRRRPEGQWLNWQSSGLQNRRLGVRVPPALLRAASRRRNSYGSGVPHGNEPRTKTRPPAGGSAHG